MVSKVNNGVASVTVNEIGHELDETEYLLQSPANRQYLLEAVEYINSGQPLVAINLDDLANSTVNWERDDEHNA